VRRLFLETKIRGKHATGITFLSKEGLSCLKNSTPADQFIQDLKFDTFVNVDRLLLIGHIRYSTSDLRYNQPFTNSTISICHNGVISQEPKETWPFKTVTANDSELILACYENGVHPLEFFHDKSMAVCTLSIDGTVSGYRNHERPLWYTKLHNGIVFTSTKDIAVRSGLENSEKCDMFVEYSYNKDFTRKVYDDRGHTDLQ
jgi:glutamine phosphoribosylpyrophosphate amidotransferase